MHLGSIGLVILISRQVAFTNGLETTICRTYQDSGSQDFVSDSFTSQVVFNDVSNSLNDCVSKADLEKVMQDLQVGYSILEDGWLSPFNGYTYFGTNRAGNRSDAKSMCLSMEADLAVIGVQDIRTRRAISRGLSLSSHVWIGLSNVTGDTWQWDNLNTATDETILWGYGEPRTTGGSPLCGIMDFDNLLTRAVNCEARFFDGICEKLVELPVL